MPEWNEQEWRQSSQAHTFYLFYPPGTIWSDIGLIFQADMENGMVDEMAEISQIPPLYLAINWKAKNSVFGHETMGKCVYIHKVMLPIRIWRGKVY